MSTDELAPFFESRETRVGRLPEEARAKLTTAAESARKSGQTDFEDQQFVSLWISRRTGLPRKDVLANFGNIAGRYFGEGVTAAAAYDQISSFYQQTGTEAPATETENPEKFVGAEGLPKMGKGALMVGVDQSARAAWGGFAGFSQRIPAGISSQMAAATGVNLKDPSADPEFRDLLDKTLRLEEAVLGDDVFTPAGMTSAFMGMRRHTPEEMEKLFGRDSSAEKLTAETKANRARMEEIRSRVDEENREAVRVWRESLKSDVSAEFRKQADFWYELSGEAMQRAGVDPEFQRSTLGQFMTSAGSVPATAALAALGPAGAIGLESSFFGQVEEERKGVEGEAYDPQKAFVANLASAGPQMVMERAFGLERLMVSVLAEVPKTGGRVLFGDFTKQFVRRGLVAGAEEGITEPAQNFWNDFIASQTYDDQRELLTPEAAKQRLVESVSAFTLGFFFAGGITAAETVDTNRAVKAGEQYLTTRDGQTMTPADFAVLRQVKSDGQLMATAPDVEMGRVLVAAANGDQQAQAAYNNAVTAAKFTSADGLEVDGLRLGEVEGVPAVTDLEDGTVSVMDMADPEARAFFDRLKVRAVQQVQEDATADTLAEMQKRHGDDLDVERTALPQTLADQVAAGRITEEQANSALEVAKIVNGLAEEATLETATVQGTADIRETAEGVFQMVATVAQAADPTVAIEEVSEAYIKRAYAERNLVPQELNAVRARWHAEQGEADPAAGLAGADLARANVEWFSKRVVDYALARRKVTLPGSWGKWLRTLGERLKMVLRGAAQMKKLMREGKLDADLESLMKGALGEISGKDVRQQLEKSREERRRAARLAELESVFSQLPEPDGSVDEQITRNAVADFEKLKAEYRKAEASDLKEAMQSGGAEPEVDAARLKRRESRRATAAKRMEEAFDAAMDKGAKLSPQAQQLMEEEGWGSSSFSITYNQQLAKIPPPAPNTVSFFTSGIPQTPQQATQAVQSRLQAKRLAASAALLQRINTGQPLPARARTVRRSMEASLAAKLFVPLTSRLESISKGLGQRVRRLDFDTNRAIAADFDAVKPFMVAFENLRDQDARILDLALKNGDTVARDAILIANNMTAEFARVQQVLTATRAKAIAAGYDVGEIADYFPRKVADLDGLMVHYYGQPESGRIEQAIAEASKKAAAAGRLLTREERIAIVNSVLAGNRRPESKPGNLKERKTDVVSVDADQFYADSVEALSSYIESLNQAIEKRRFFGRFAVPVAGAPGAVSSQLALEASVGAYVEDLIATGDITRQQQAEVQAILEARFAYGVQSDFVRNFKALAYLSTMGQITSAMSQVTDLAFSLYENGVWDTAVTLGQAVAKGSKISRKDLGLEQVAEEFRDAGKLHKALDRTFRYVGIHYLDQIGKETLVNAKFRKMQREATGPTGLSQRSQLIISRAFGAGGAQVVTDIAAGKKTEDTIFAVYTVLADYQPLTQSEYPEYYLRHPNGRIFYMLKSFTLKQFDSFRREAVSKIVSGTAKQKVEGFRNLAHMAGLLFLIGCPIDWLKDFIMGRRPQMDDIMVDNVFKLLGVNRWALWRFRESGNPIEAGLLLVAPPAPFIVYPIADVMTAAGHIAEGEDIEPGNFETWRALPFVGSPIYWWLGGGKEKIEAKEARERGSETPAR